MWENILDYFSALDQRPVERMAFLVGGLLFSTFLTLVIVPVVYTLLARFTSVKEKKAAEPVG